MPILVDWAQLEANCGNIETARDIYVDASQRAQDSHMPLYQAWAVFEEKFGSRKVAERLRAAQIQIEQYNASQHAGAHQQEARLAASTTQHVLAALDD